MDAAQHRLGMLKNSDDHISLGYDQLRRNVPLFGRWRRTPSQ
jgi:hypothetical protein